MRAAWLAGLLGLVSPAAALDSPGLARVERSGDLYNDFGAAVSPPSMLGGALGGVARLAGAEPVAQPGSTPGEDFGGTLLSFDSHDVTLAGALRHLDAVVRPAEDSAPAEAAAAASYRLRLSTWRLLTALEATMPHNGALKSTLALEASRRLRSGLGVSLRFGYDTRSAGGLGLPRGMSSGLCVRGGPFSIDAAFAPQSALGETFRLSVAWRI